MMMSDHIAVRLIFLYKVLIDYLSDHHLRPTNAKIILSHILIASRLF